MWAFKNYLASKLGLLGIVIFYLLTLLSISLPFHGALRHIISSKIIIGLIIALYLFVISQIPIIGDVVTIVFEVLGLIDALHKFDLYLIIYVVAMLYVLLTSYLPIITELVKNRRNS